MSRLAAALPKLRGLPAADWAPRHRAIVVVIALHAPALFAFALLQGLPLWHAVVEAVFPALFAVVASSSRFSRVGRSCLAAVGLVTCSALVVHVADGAVEAHFHFFVVLPIIGLYGDWKPFLVAVGYIVLHHAVFALLVPDAVFPVDHGLVENLGTTLVHAGFVVAQIVALVAAWKLAEQQAEALEARNAELDARQRELDATVAELEASSEARRASLETITAMTGEVRESARTVSGSADEIRETVTRNTVAASQQSAAMEQAAGAVEQARAVAERTAGEAKSVAGDALRSLELTEAGTAALSDIVSSLDRIGAEVGSTADGVLALSDRVRQIGEITKAVDELSEQSKMLALNASIEAARAGEHGRGFAVVADEVRALAERSRESTAAVEEILREIDVATREAVVSARRGTEVVEASAARAKETGAVIARLSDASRTSAERAEEIAAAIDEQRLAIEEVAAAIRSAADSTGELVEVATHADEVAGRLQGLAGELEQLTERTTA